MESWKIINGIKTHFIDMGQGPTLLILHGWNSGISSWDKTAGLIANKGVRVIVPDMPGFGKSDKPNTPWNMDDYESWAMEFIEILGLKNIHLAGHSFGGGLSIMLALHKKELLKTLTLLSTARLRSRRSIYRSLVKSLAKAARIFSFVPFSAIIRKIFYRIFVRSDDYIKTEGVMRETFRNVINVDLSNLVSSIKLPTLIIWGDKDKVTPIKDAYLLKDRIDDAMLNIIHGVGHSPNIECPEKLGEIMLGFINK